jgi:hypothetical protein
MKLTQRPELAVGVLGLGLVQIVSLYEATAPSLSELRHSPEGHLSRQQELMDATILVGSVTAFLAVLSSYATKSFLPAAVFLGGFAIVAGWHYLVLHSPQV